MVAFTINDSVWQKLTTHICRGACSWPSLLLPSKAANPLRPRASQIEAWVRDRPIRNRVFISILANALVRVVNFPTYVQCARTNLMENLNAQRNSFPLLWSLERQLDVMPIGCCLFLYLLHAVVAHVTLLLAHVLYTHSC